MKQSKLKDCTECSKNDLMAVKDVLEVLNCRWKLQILISLLSGKKGFKQIARDIDRISDRILTKD